MSTQTVPTDQINGVTQTSDYTLSVSLATGSGQLQDITPLIMKFNLYESLFSPCMTGEMEFGDGLDIITNFSLNGNEWVYVKLDKPSLNKPIQKAFRIYKISNRQTSTQSIQNYIIHFCSEELILSSQTYVRKSYNGSVDSMIKNILNDYLNASSKINNNNFIKPLGNYSFVISRMRPFEAINWLATRSFGSNENLYFFYETADGFNFSSFENLINTETYTSYFWGPNIKHDPSTNYQTILYFKIDNDFDILMGNKMGQFSSSLYNLDIVKRTYSKTTWNGNSYDESRLLNTYLPTDQTKNRIGKSLFDNPDAVAKYMITSDADSTTNPILPQNWLLQNYVKSAQLRGLKFTIVIPSDFQIRAGRIVTLNMPAGVPQDANSSERRDLYRTGSYLVTAVRHGITDQISSTTLELLSDSFNQPLPNPVDNSAPLQQLKGL